MAWRAPLELLGIGGERRVLRLPLFLGYRELRDAPFATFRATLQARASRAWLQLPGLAWLPPFLVYYSHRAPC